jgi:hypothetical protein
MRRTEDVFVAYVVVTVMTIIANSAIAVADLRRAKSVLANMAEVGVPQKMLPLIATLKAAGAAGLLIGLLGIVLDVPGLPYLGVAAAFGLVLFFAGALISHVRARVFYNIYYPGSYWLLAIASLALVLAQL